MRGIFIKKLGLKMIVLLIIATIIGLLALVLVYSLPVNSMKGNVESSISVFYSEGTYPQVIDGYKMTQLDSNTDALMVLHAIYDGSESAIVKAMDIKSVMTSGGGSKDKTLVSYLWLKDEISGTADYPRYWHGYLVYLKPLLLFMDYADIRILNMILQLVVLVLVVSAFVKRGLQKYVVPYALAISVLDPIVLPLSLQYSSVYYIMQISLLFLVNRKRWIEESKERIYIFFFLIGIVTSYMDFLTYPLITLSFPLIVLSLMDNEKCRSAIYKIVSLSICWELGYLFMWLNKWVVGSIILKRNLFVEAFEHVSIQTSNAVMDGQTLDSLDVIIKNMRVIAKWPFLFVFGLFILWQLFNLRRTKRKELVSSFMNSHLIPLVLVMFIPVVWLAIANTHSSWHYWFTYRELSASVFAGFCILVKFINIVRDHKKIEISEKSANCL